MRGHEKTLLRFVFAALICSAGQHVVGQETKTFVAYSMKVAQARVEAAVEAGEDFRKKQPDLYYLGGITKPWAVVLDTASNDYILVGERDPKSSILTLDDWVVALRARFIYPDKDPGVTINPRPCEECLSAGKKESCRHHTKQDVRFFAGIENTHFGQVCYEADWLMKKIGLGLEKLPVEKLKTYYDLSLEQHRNAGRGQSRGSSRFWFYPIVNRVNIIGDVVLLEKFQMGVFTELLYAEIDGKPVADVDEYNHYPSENFSRSFSENYDAAAEAREVLETLRGLTRLAAVAKGLTHVDTRPDVGLWLTGYPLEQPNTVREADVLTVENRGLGFKIFGGVELMALAMRLKEGDLSALRELVLKARPTVQSLSWSFHLSSGIGALPASLAKPSPAPKDLAALFAQGVFLYSKGRYDAAREAFTSILLLDPAAAGAYHNRGTCYWRQGRSNLALADLDHAIRLSPSAFEIYNTRAVVFHHRAEYGSALRDYNAALAINPAYANAYMNRGNLYADQGDFAQALADYNQAILLDPRNAAAYNDRGIVFEEKGELDRSITDYGRALALEPTLIEAYCNRARAYRSSQEYERAFADYGRAISIDPSSALAYKSRGMAFLSMGKMLLSFRDFKTLADLNLRARQPGASALSADIKLGSEDMSIISAAHICGAIGGEELAILAVTCRLANTSDSTRVFSLPSDVPFPAPAPSAPAPEPVPPRGVLFEPFSTANDGMLDLGGPLPRGRARIGENCFVEIVEPVSFSLVSLGPSETLEAGREFRYLTRLLLPGKKADYKNFRIVLDPGAVGDLTILFDYRDICAECPVFLIPYLYSDRGSARQVRYAAVPAHGYRPEQSPCGERLRRAVSRGFSKLSAGATEQAVEEWDYAVKWLLELMGNLETPVVAVETRKEYEAYVKEARAGAIWVDKHFGMAIQGLAYSAVSVQEFDAALRLCEMGLTVAPFHIPLYCEKAYILQRRARHEDALREYGAALEIAGRFGDDARLKARALRGRGSVLIDLKRWAEAQRHFEESLLLEPDNPVARKELEYISQNMGGIGEAP